MYNLSSICKSANALVKKGYTASEAFKKAWALAKEFISKVSGTSFGRRNEALERLTRYNLHEVDVFIERAENIQDGNAIGVYAKVNNSKPYMVGYVPKDLARILAPLMDIGKVDVKAKLQSIVGGFFEGMNYGMRILLWI